MRLSPRAGRDSTRSISAISSSFVETLDIPEIVAPSRRLLLQSGTLDSLKLSTSLTLEMDATNFWISILGFDMVTVGPPRGDRLSLSSLANDGW